MRGRSTITTLIRLVLFAAVDCAFIRYCLVKRSPGFFFGMILVFLPLINASLWGVMGLARGYRIKIRRRDSAGQAPYSIRFGLICFPALLTSVLVLLAGRGWVDTYQSLAEAQLDRWLVSAGFSVYVLDDGSPPLGRVVFLWALFSGPPLLVVSFVSFLSHRYRLAVEKRA